MKNSLDNRRSAKSPGTDSDTAVQLPRLPRLGALLDEIADSAEAIVQGTARNADAAELNRFRLEGVKKISVLESAYSGFDGSVTKPGTLDVFKAEIAKGYDSNSLIEKYFAVMQALRPLAAGQRSIL
jgi:hypothetical protein